MMCCIQHAANYFYFFYQQERKAWEQLGNIDKRAASGFK